MIEPTWKLMPLLPMQTTQVVFREWEDGRQESCLVTAEEYVKWVEAGGQTLPADSE
jgi:hypothetical protein